MIRVSEADYLAEMEKAKMEGDNNRVRALETAHDIIGLLEYSTIGSTYDLVERFQRIQLKVRLMVIPAEGLE